MFIAYTNTNISSQISLDDDSTDPEVNITINGSDDIESSHYFQNLTQFDEFIDSAVLCVID